MSEEKNVDDLKWVRLFNPTLIPRYLVEQVKDRDYEVDDFFKYQELNCLMQKDGVPTLNPFNHLYALVNPKNIVKGYMWASIDPLSKEMIINTFSVAKEYWHHGEAIKVLSSHVKEILKKLKISKVYWLTTSPKHSKKFGFKASKSVLMQYEPDEQQSEEKKDG